MKKLSETQQPRTRASTLPSPFCHSERLIWGTSEMRERLRTASSYSTSLRRRQIEVERITETMTGYIIEVSTDGETGGVNLRDPSATMSTQSGQRNGSNFPIYPGSRLPLRVGPSGSTSTGRPGSSSSAQDRSLSMPSASVVHHERHQSSLSSLEASRSRHRLQSSTLSSETSLRLQHPSLPIRVSQRALSSSARISFRSSHSRQSSSSSFSSTTQSISDSSSLLQSPLPPQTPQAAPYQNSQILSSAFAVPPATTPSDNPMYDLLTAPLSTMTPSMASRAVWLRESSLGRMMADQMGARIGETVDRGLTATPSVNLATRLSVSSTSRTDTRSSSTSTTSVTLSGSIPVPSTPSNSALRVQTQQQSLEDNQRKRREVRNRLARRIREDVIRDARSSGSSQASQRQQPQQPQQQHQAAPNDTTPASSTPAWHAATTATTTTPSSGSLPDPFLPVDRQQRITLDQILAMRREQMRREEDQRQQDTIERAKGGEER